MGHLPDFILIWEGQGRRGLTLFQQRPVLLRQQPKYSQNSFYKGVLDVSYEPLVSSDVIGTTASAIVDLSFTRVIDSDLVKVLAWYDNEWGYSNRLVEIALM